MEKLVTVSDRQKSGENTSFHQLHEVMRRMDSSKTWRRITTGRKIWVKKKNKICIKVKGMIRKLAATVDKNDGVLPEYDREC